MKTQIVAAVLFLGACTANTDPQNLTNFEYHDPYMVGWNVSNSELCSSIYVGNNDSYKIKAIKEWYVNDRFFQVGYERNRDYVNRNIGPNIDTCHRTAAIIEAEYEGKGILQSNEAAVSNIKEAANNGDAVAQNNLGLIYSRGKRIPLDYAAARRWFTMAATQGYAMAQNNLGDMYANNRFVPENYEEGLRWYRRAANQGNANAQFSLGRMYYYGQAVRKDYERSLMWYSIASEQGHYEAATLKQRLEKKMTKTEIEKAKKLTHDCITSGYKDC